MTNYKRILALVDFSGHTDAVIQSAVMQVACSGSMFSVLHVVDYTRPLDDDYIQPPVDTAEETLLAAAREKLEETLRRLGVANASVIVVCGNPRHEILRVAEREVPDLIVIGAHGHHGISDLLGSTTDRVLHRASCHVLTVR
jgi:nucleotide-binding universal stress UspA family protein